ncbi:MAG: SpoIIE family protein phosphatase [Clostridiales bacterium]|nr:SpoIIE family protein phosphatase [Clostridiales bacterium]
MSKSKTKISPLVWLSAAVVLVVCCGGKLYGLIPFGAAAFCALSCEVFIGLVAPLYLLCAFLFTFEVWRLYTAGAVIFVMAVRWFLALKIPRFGKPVSKYLFSAFAVVLDAVLSGLFMPTADAALSGVVGLLFLYFAFRAAVVVKLKFGRKCGVTEAAAMFVISIVAGLCFARAFVSQFLIGLAPAFFLLLMLGVSGSLPALVCGSGVAVGLGLAFSPTLGLSMLPLLLAIVAFGSLPRIVTSITAIGVYAATAVLLGVDPVAMGWNCLMLAAGGFLFCILPRLAVQKVRSYFDFDGSARLAVRHYINRSKADAGNRMLAVASVFDETARLMNAVGDATPDYVAIGMTLADKVCPYCPARSACDRVTADQAFALLAERAHRGKAIISDLPEFFTSSCAMCPDVISASASITDAARARARERESEDKAKVIVTERLKAIKDVLEELGKSQAQPVGFDGTTERRIVNELNNNGVECAEVFCSSTGGVTAVVRTQSAARESIRKAVSVCMKRNYEVSALEKTQAAGWSVAMLKRKPSYEAVYARAGLGKDGISGDSYTFERIGDRFLTALCDGMGSGVRASESSSAAVELIECFYRAGFDSQSVLTGVNRFLKLPTTENYSASDVAVFDLDNASVDIIKIGAPPCYIKTADTVLRIEGSALPIGVLDEMRPVVTTKRLYPGQMLILVTDGVSDCFEGDELPEFINGLSAFNPETAVNALINRALELSGGVPRDDMTAVAVRLFDAPKKKIKIKSEKITVKKQK